MEDMAIHSPLILVAAEDMQRFQEIVPGELGLYGVVSATTSIVTLVGRDAEAVEVRVAPMLCLGFLASHRSFLPLLSRTRERFREWSAYQFPEPALLDPSEPVSQVDALLATSLISHLRASARQTTRLSRELARLRAAHEDLHNAFSAIEAFVGSSNLQPCRLVFENLPVPNMIVRGDHYPVGLAQLLPASSIGLSAIQIHVAKATYASDLVAELRTVEDRKRHGVWRIGADQIGTGWLTLTLPNAVGGLQRTPELIIRTQDPANPLPDFSGGAPQPVAAFRPRAPMGSSSAPAPTTCSLALRVWAGLPGVRPPALGQSLSPPRSGAIAKEAAVPFEMLETIAEIPGEWQPGFSPVHVFPELRGLVCHPPPHGVTIGEMRGVDLREPARISVRAIIRNEEANPVDFALAYSNAARDQVAAQLRSEAAVDKALLEWTGWQRVNPGEPLLMEMQVAPPASGDGSLYFATRMSDGRHNEFAWATFYDLRVTMLADRQRTAANRLQHAVVSATAPSPEWAPLPSTVLETVTHVRTEDLGAWNLDAPAVTYDFERQGILCHPPSVEFTLGRIAGCVPNHPVWLLARGYVAHPTASPTEFCLIASDLPISEVQQRLQREDESDPNPHFASTGWKIASPEEQVWLHLRWGGTKARRADLYLATRMAYVDDSNEYAWAIFSDLSFAEISPISVARPALPAETHQR